MGGDKPKGFGNKENEDKRGIFGRNERKFHPFSENKAYFSKASQPLDLVRNKYEREKKRIENKIERNLTKEEKDEREIGKTLGDGGLNESAEKKSRRSTEQSFVEISNQYGRFHDRLVRKHGEIQNQYVESQEKELKRNKTIEKLDQEIQEKQDEINALKGSTMKGDGGKRRRLGREKFRKEVYKRTLTDKNGRAKTWRVILEGRIDWRSKQIEALSGFIKDIEHKHLVNEKGEKKYWPSHSHDYTEYVESMSQQVEQYYQDTLDPKNKKDFEDRSKLVKAALKLRTLSLQNYTKQRELGAEIQQLQQNIGNRIEEANKWLAKENHKVDIDTTLNDDQKKALKADKLKQAQDYYSQLGTNWEKSKTELQTNLIAEDASIKKLEEAFETLKTKFQDIENKAKATQPQDTLTSALHTGRADDTDSINSLNGDNDALNTRSVTSEKGKMVHRSNTSLGKQDGRQLTWLPTKKALTIKWSKKDQTNQSDAETSQNDQTRGSRFSRFKYKPKNDPVMALLKQQAADIAALRAMIAPTTMASSRFDGITSAPSDAEGEFPIGLGRSFGLGAKRTSRVEKAPSVESSKAVFGTVEGVYDRSIPIPPPHREVPTWSDEKALPPIPEDDVGASSALHDESTIDPDVLKPHPDLVRDFPTASEVHGKTEMPDEKYEVEEEGVD
jgi:hypothetical protein